MRTSKKTYWTINNLTSTDKVYVISKCFYFSGVRLIDDSKITTDLASGWNIVNIQK